jgi:hypothetical protein
MTPTSPARRCDRPVATLACQARTFGQSCSGSAASSSATSASSRPGGKPPQAAPAHAAALQRLTATIR